MITNRGIVSHGDNNNLNNNAVGEHARVSVATPSNNNGTPADEEAADERTATWDIGVVTILSEELRSVVDELKLERQKEPGGLHFYRGKHITPESTIHIVATQSQSQGQRSAMAALENLRRHYDPRLWALVGVGGGIHDEHARIGNVIVSTDIVYYENRKINPRGNVRRRGEHRQAPAPVVHAVNAFFTDHGTPARVHGQLSTHATQEFEVYPGVIGSGEAVIADRESDIRSYLTNYHEKVLAVDMEAGGLSQYWQENSIHGAINPGWIVIRGVSDNADEEKGHGYHELAARNAAHILRQLLPYIC
ncbi:5'-methylthioadenosine/S-adenosylhomocysteine nucleosidase family protein [Streptomyces tubercidicus]